MLTQTLPLAAQPNLAVVDQDRSARLREVVHQHYRLVWTTLRRLGVASADIEDAVQQVFWVVARKLDDVPIDKERSFLFGAAVRVASDHRRSVRRRRESDEQTPEQLDAGPGPEDVVAQRRNLAVLDRILAAMPMDLRTVFVLYEIEEMQISEIAQVVGIPMGTVASRLRRARRQFETLAEQARGNDAGRGS